MKDELPQGWPVKDEIKHVDVGNRDIDIDGCQAIKNGKLIEIVRIVVCRGLIIGCSDKFIQCIGASRKYVVYGGDDEFPIGNDVRVISLAKLMQELQS